MDENILLQKEEDLWQAFQAYYKYLGATDDQIATIWHKTSEVAESTLQDSKKGGSNG